MAYVKVDGKWVPRSSLQDGNTGTPHKGALSTPATASMPCARAAADTSSQIRALDPAALHCAGSGHTAASEEAAESPYRAVKGSHWIIDDFLSVGGAGSAGCVRARRQREEQCKSLLDHGITHIINCAAELECSFRYDFQYLHLHASDNTGENMIALWPEACTFIEDARLRKGRVLVHCAGGVSRSGSTAVAYLMKHCNLPLNEALAEAQKRRNQILPNPGFVEQLQLWEKLGFTAPSNGELRSSGIWRLRPQPLEVPHMELLHRLPRPQPVEDGAQATSLDAASMKTASNGTAEAQSLDASADAEAGVTKAPVTERLPICIQFCSDMHLELPLETKRFGQHLHDCLMISDPDLERSEDMDVSANVLPRVGPGVYLALLGDVVDGAKIRDGTYRNYLLRQSAGFEAVFILAGNHEFYRAEYDTSRALLAALCKEVTDELGGSPVVHFLDCSWVDLPGTDIRVLGCTLWSAVGEESEKEVSKSLSDYSAISVLGEDGVSKRKATVADTNAWHVRELAWLEAEIGQAAADERRCVVMTHHAPTFHDTAPPKYGRTAISSAFSTDLEKLLRPPVSAWLFGHTHWSSWQQYSPEGRWVTLSGNDGGPHDADFTSFGSCDARKGHVIVASNQLGYGAKGEHRNSRCHPYMALTLSPDGYHTSLRCAAHG